jgi:hypothetical protein
VKVYARLAMKAGVISTDELQLIKAVSGYSGKEAKRIDERRPVERVGDKKEEHVSLAPVDAAALKDQDLENGAGAAGRAAHVPAAGPRPARLRGRRPAGDRL